MDMELLTTAVTKVPRNRMTFSTSVFPLMIPIRMILTRNESNKVKLVG